MNLYVREYDWMWKRLNLSLAECRVYAYILALTKGNTGGYNGSKRHLAELLGLDAGGVKKILDTLTGKHLIVYSDSQWQSVDSVNTSDVDSVNGSVDSVNESVDSVNSPRTPLYNNINNNKNNASMQTDLFEKFWKFFSPAPEYHNRRAATQMIFEARSSAAQQAIVEAAQEGAPGHPGDNPNPYFFVQDFPEPQPTWLRGDEKDLDIVQVFHNGRYLLCTRETMKLFNLQYHAEWKP